MTPLSYPGAFVNYLILTGILIASIQDLKRREVDNWLNLLLIFSGFAYLALKSVFELNPIYFFFGAVSFLIMYALANAFYYSRIFAGGDAKLLLAMFALFAGVSLSSTMADIGIFIIFLMLSGSLWGGFYSIILFASNFKKSTREIKKYFSNFYFRSSIFAGIILFALSFFNIIFLFASVFVFISALLYIFAKAVEKTSLTKEIPGGELREGDWLADDVKTGKRTIKAEWAGLSLDDIKILKKLKKIKIKEGIPFVPAFLIAVLLWFFRGRILDFIFMM